MRSAERAKVWATIRDHPQREVQLATFSFRGIPGVVDGSVDFGGPITAICGINGSGKSSLLRSIWASIKGTESSKVPEVRERLASLEATISLRVGTEDLISHRKSQNPESDLAIDLLHIDPSTIAARLQKDICAVNDLSELLEPISPIKMAEKDLKLLSFILNKNYDSAEIFEIEDYADLPPFPVIVASEHGSSYDIRTMSLGEISIFTIFWALQRAKRNAVVLLEEPETFLSPVSQGAFFDYLAQQCVQKQLSLILTTHSPQMFSRLNKGQIKFMYRTPQGARVANDDQFDAMRSAVGIEHQVDLVLVVEDRAAREFTRCILRKLDHSLYLRSEIVDVGGLGDITRICQSFPVRTKSFELIAVYDGDSRDELSKTKVDWKHTLLPSDIAIEDAFRDLTEANSASIAEKLNLRTEDIDLLLAKIRGLDHHDWYEELAKELHISYSQLMNACFDLWHEDDQNGNSAQKFVTNLHAIARPRN